MPWAAPAGLLVGAATAAGLVNPPLSPGMRSLWSAYVGPRLKQTAFALDAAVFDLAYITGPVLASALATGVAPAAAVAVLLALTGIAVLAAAAAGRPAGPAGPGRPGWPAAVRRTAQAVHHRGAGQRRAHRDRGRADRLRPAPPCPLGRRARCWPRYRSAASWAACCSAPAPRGPERGSRLPRLLAGYACGLGLLTAAGLYAPLLAVAAPLAGFCLGPTLAALFGAAAAAAPRGGGTETQSWLNSLMNGGAAAGAAMAGLASVRPVLALGLAASAAVAAFLSAVVTARRPVAREGP